MLRQTIKDLNDTRKFSFNDQENIPENKFDQTQIEDLRRQVNRLLDEKATLYLENENLKTHQREYEINIVRNRRVKMERKYTTKNFH